VIGGRNARARRVGHVGLPAQQQDLDARAVHLRVQPRDAVASHAREIQRAHRRRHGPKR
jgi:hypothetical protein